MLRLGIVDFDSSHSIEFTRRFNHVGVDADQCVEGARVVLGCPGTSLMSSERIPGFTRQIAECGVELVERPEQMIGRMDAVLVLSICGQAHRERATPFLAAGIPTFVDKPFACSLGDAAAMVRLAREKQTVLLTSSALRFAGEIDQFRARAADYGRLHGVVSHGPAKRAEGNPGLFHYGIHAVEVLFTLMGPGCRSVTTVCTEGAESATGRWSDGRLGTLRGIRAGSTAYGCLAFCEHGVVHQPISARYAYRNLCRAMVESFTSGRAVVDPELSLEIVRFVLASLQSERNGSAEVALDAVT